MATTSTVKSEISGRKAWKQNVIPPQHQLQPEKQVKLSYLECAKRALQEQECQGLPQQNKGLRQPALAERHMVNAMDTPYCESSSSEKHETSLSDCETFSGDNASSEQSDSELSDSEYFNTSSIAPTVEENNTNTYAPTVSVPAASPAARLPGFQVAEVAAQPLDWDVACGLDHKQRLAPNMLPSETSNQTKKLSSEARLFVPETSSKIKKLSSEARLFVPEASNKTKKLSCEARLFVPMAPRGQLSTSALAHMAAAKAAGLYGAVPANIPPSVAPSQAFALPPGLCMSLRKEAVAFVPSATTAP